MGKQAAGNPTPKSLRQRSNRYALISVFLFATLIGTVSYDYYGVSTALQGQRALQQAEVRLMRFATVLPALLAPVDHFMLSGGDGHDQERQSAAFTAFQRNYSDVSSLPDVDSRQNARLKQVFDLAQHAQDIATAILGGQQVQAKDLALTAHALLTVAQAKAMQMAQAVGDVQRRQEQDMQSRMTMLAGINLAIVVVLLLVTIVLMRGLAKGAVRALTDLAADAASASGAMLETAEQQVQVAETQALSLSEVIRDMEQMSAASAKIAATAGSVERIAETMVRAAEQAGRDVGEAGDQMQGIRDAVQAIAERGRASREKAEHIMESLASVQEIADETHLLALNASIESAAAGEHGKRFAVVAAEVRHLAERVREFTDEIEGVVGEVETAAAASMALTQGGLVEVDRGIEVAQRAKEALGHVQGISGKTGQAVRAIAQATARQDKAGQGYLEGMRQMAKALDDSLQQLQDSRDLSHRLMGVAEDLQRLI